MFLLLFIHCCCSHCIWSLCVGFLCSDVVPVSYLAEEKRADFFTLIAMYAVYVLHLFLTVPWVSLQSCDCGISWSCSVSFDST